MTIAEYLEELKAWKEGRPNKLVTRRSYLSTELFLRGFDIQAVEYAERYRN